MQGAVIESTWMTKTNSYTVLAAGLLVELYALFLSFASAPDYDPIFLRIVACSAIGIAALVYLGSRRHWVGAITLGVLVLYTSLDVGLRYFAHMRPLDLFGT